MKHFKRIWFSKPRTPYFNLVSLKFCVKYKKSFERNQKLLNEESKITNHT